MVETGHWHPVVASGSLGARPLAATLLGQDLVLWRDGDGVAHAWQDRCPHRGARLSLGRVREGQLECPYHGWRFDGSGQCRHVPALPAFTPPASSCAKTHAVLEAYGLCWVQLGADDEVALPAFVADADARLRKVLCGPYDVAASAPRIVENFLDMSHFAFVHEGWLGERGHEAMADYQVTRTPTGLRATGCRAWQPQSNRLSTTGAEVEYTYDVTAPYSAVLTKVPDPHTLPAAFQADGGYREAIGLFVCPQTPESSRVWFCLAVADFESTEEQLRSFQHTIFTQDQPVLESQTPKRLPLDLRAEQHTAADKASSAYRRYLKETGITFGVC